MPERRMAPPACTEWPSGSVRTRWIVQRVALATGEARLQHFVHAVEELGAANRCGFAASESEEEEDGTNGNKCDAGYHREYHAAVIGA